MALRSLGRPDWQPSLRKHSACGPVRQGRGALLAAGAVVAPMLAEAELTDVDPAATSVATRGAVVREADLAPVWSHPAHTLIVLALLAPAALPLTFRPTTPLGVGSLPLGARPHGRT
eukprot:3669967-Lingulodinium_polyedra.AAC.1